MKPRSRLVICFALVTTCVIASWAHEQYLPTQIGDYVLAAVDEYALAFDPLEMSLPVKGRPLANGDYSVECRVLFVDGKNRHRKTKEDVDRYLMAGDILNELVKEYLVLKYEGLGYEDFLSKYLIGDVRHALNGDPAFLVWLCRRINGMDDDVYHPDLEMVKVQIEARGDFKKDLIDHYRASLPDE